MPLFDASSRPSRPSRSTGAQSFSQRSATNLIVVVATLGLVVYLTVHWYRRLVQLPGDVVEMEVGSVGADAPALGESSGKAAWARHHQGQHAVPVVAAVAVGGEGAAAEHARENGPGGVGAALLGAEDGAAVEGLGLAADGDLNAGGILTTAMFGADADGGANAEASANPLDACRVNLGGMSHAAKLAFFDNNPHCQYINACQAVLEPANNTGLVQTRLDTYIYRFTEDVRYTHMAMLVQLPDARWMATWQAAPSAGNGTGMRLGMEGLDAQHLVVSHSRDPEGRQWSAPQKLPLRNKGSLWSPVMHVDSTGRVWLFYSESVDCRKAMPCSGCKYPPCELKPSTVLCHMEPKLWVPGGDVKVVTSIGDPALNKWTPARTLLKQSGPYGTIAKVISDSLTVLSTGEWILPYWREQAKSAIPDSGCKRDPETNTSSCVLSEGGSCMTGAEEYAGILKSTDEGATWKTYGNLVSIYTTLIEGSLVELKNSTLFMVFRTTTGCLFSTTSPNKGVTWEDPRPMVIPNPNSKVQMMKLEPRGELLIAFNNHRPPGGYRGLKACKACRTRLHLALSEDSGESWAQVHSIDEEMSSSAIRLHYPSMVQMRGFTTKVAIVYSRFYLGRRVGLNSLDQGIKFVTIDLAKALKG